MNNEGFGRVLSTDRCDDFIFSSNNMVLSVVGGKNIYTLPLPNEISVQDQGCLYIALDKAFFTFNSTLPNIAPANNTLVTVLCNEIALDPVSQLPVLDYNLITTSPYYNNLQISNPRYYKVIPQIDLGGSTQGIKQLTFQFVSTSTPGVTFVLTAQSIATIRISRSNQDWSGDYVRPGRLRDERRIRSIK